MAGLKLTPIILKEVNKYLTSPKKVRKFGFDQPPVKTGKDIKRPEDPFREFEERNPQADGGRAEFSTGRNVGKTSPVKTEVFKYPRTNRFGTVYSDTPATGIKRNLITDDIGKSIVEEYKKGASTVKLSKKYGFNKDTINRYIKKNAPGVLRTQSQGINQYNFDPKVIDEIKEDAKTMSRKEILKKYKGKISKTKLDKEKLTFGKVEEAGRPRVPEGERSPKQVKRANRIRNAQGFDVSGTFQKNFHHIFPIGGLSELSAKDVMILDKKFNETLGGFNLQLNDIADEIGSMDLSDPNALKRLNDLNAKSKNLVDRAKAKLPKNLKNAIGYIEYQPVFDENGTIFELSQVRKGVDKNSSQLAKFGNKKFKNYSTKEKQNFKKEVKRVANLAENRGLMMAANPMFSPGVLGEAFKSVPTPLGAVALTAGFGVDPTSAIDRAGIAAEAAFAPALVKQSAKMGAAQRLFNLGLTPKMAMRAARIASPLGIASLGLEGLYQAGKFTKKRIGELKAMSPEQRRALRARQEAFAFEGAREGGIIGKKSGPPPVSGPTPHGDEGLPVGFKRVKKQ